MLEPVEIEKYKRNYLDFDPSRVLQELSEVLYLPEMDEDSVWIVDYITFPLWNLQLIENLSMTS